MTTQQEHYNWIMSIIDSCLHTFHFDCVDKMIELFTQHHPEEDNLHTLLKLQRTTRFNNVHNILV